MEYKISTLIISLVLFSAIIVGTSMFYGGLLSNYDLDVEDLSTLAVTEEIREMGEEVKDRLTDNPFDDTVLEAFYAAGVSVWESMQIMFGSFSLVQNTITAIITKIPILVPSWFGSIAITIVVLIIIFALASAMLKWGI